jgi:hypothetical protein
MADARPIIVIKRKNPQQPKSPDPVGEAGASNHQDQPNEPPKP